MKTARPNYSPAGPFLVPASEACACRAPLPGGLYTCSPMVTSVPSRTIWKDAVLPDPSFNAR